MAKVILKVVICAIALLLKDVSSNNCTSQQTCGKCISENSQCTWCSQENFGNNGAPRCDYIWNLLERDCDPEYIYDPVNHLKIIENRKFGHHFESEDVYIRPQEIKIQLRPNSVRKFWVDFRQIHDFPLDLYLLIDLSTADDKQKMIQLGHKLADELPGITTNFRIGFGTFVEKQRESCIDCAPSYAFQNVMPLSSDTNMFTRKVEEAPGSVNLYAPDGGRNVIMKAIVCKEEIGWREKSKKILLYASDNYYNYTTLEQFHEMVTPDDEFCQLGRNDYFIMGTELDYNSLSQIDYQIRKTKIRIIFAVTTHQLPFYDTLSRNLSGSSIAALYGDLSNIIDLIREQYDKIRSSVEIRDSLNDDNIKLTYYSKCRGSDLQERNYCRGLKKGTDVTFEIEMKLQSCPSQRMERNKRFSIYPVGLSAHLTVDLEILCECGCEKPILKEINSSKCNGYGTFECGACTCNNYRYGGKCECVAMDTEIPQDAYKGCKKNANDSVLCSGRGDCICGVCDCFPRQSPWKKVYGRFCECDNFHCNTHDGKVCGGPNHGICDCGKCVCHNGWDGPACGCRNSDMSCFIDRQI